jgi:TM2 domain-containing membrane protein YozV
MTAYGFGRKGVSDVAAAPRRAGLLASQQPRSFQPMRDVADPGEDAEARRAAFLAQERGRDAPPAGPAALPSAEIEKAAEALKAESVLVPTDRSLRTAYLLWFFLGLGGGHRFYLRRPLTGAIQASLFLGCVGAVVAIQYYEAFAGLALSWLWYLADGIRLRHLHKYSGPR